MWPGPQFVEAPFIRQTVGRALNDSQGAGVDTV
jgi:hypothetical protein